jgi:hypothetical protein
MLVHSAMPVSAGLHCCAHLFHLHESLSSKTGLPNDDTPFELIYELDLTSVCGDRTVDPFMYTILATAY